MGQCRSDGEPFKHNAKTAVFNLKEQECGLVALTSLRNETEGLGNSRNVAQNIKNKCSVKEKKEKSTDPNDCYTRTNNTFRSPDNKINTS